MSENLNKKDLKKAKADEKAKSDKPKKAKNSFFKRVAKWFKEMKSELKKVLWPDAKTVAKNTGIVIICVIVVGIFVCLFDLLATSVINALLNLAGKG